MGNPSNNYLCNMPQSKFSSLFLSFLLHCLIISIASDSAPPYTPTENITLSCGFSDNSIASLDGRIWIGDIKQLQNNASVTSATAQPAPSITVPYRTARLSRSEFTYVFPQVTAGKKFIRLYFYPVTYQNYERSEALFSVKVGPYTLLQEFNASVTADADANPSNTIQREFCINIEDDQGLNITFAPSHANLEAYAFINGIEIISMPPFLYYSAEKDQGFEFIGQENNLARIENDHALETLYRINVGGSDISPAQDTGMFRTWSSDGDYLTVPGSSVLPVNLTIRILFKGTAPYTAPEEVYRTARTMGTDKEINKNYSLTWEFPVDYGFSYLVRLHFCEFQPEINKEGDRVFLIFIDNQIAEKRFDVISSSGGKGVPVYKDYAVLMPTAQGKEKKLINLSVALRANPADWQTVRSDAILNGIEIFKLSDFNRNLAGPNPDPLPIIPTTTAPPSQFFGKQTRVAISKKTKSILGIVVPGVVVLSIIGFLLFRRAKRVKRECSSNRTSWWHPFSFSKTKSNQTSGSYLPSDLCRYFSLAEIRAATNNFNDVFIIGVGGFGNVYKGYIDDGATPVAIKRLNPGSQQGAHEFKTEIEMLSQLRHLNLVSLIGYCNDGREMILIYDYMAQGTFRDHLYNTDNPPLSWKQRLEICIGAARGLHYLHRGAKQTIIHRDVKTTNILLDEKWVAKVSDFGLSRMGPTGVSMSHVSTVVKGSIGYLDPEYYRRQQLTEKSDVYSFGVVLCEVLCGRPPLIRNADKEQVSLAEWTQQWYRRGKLDHIVDPFLKGKIARECLEKFGEIAINCMLDNGMERPSMSDVVWGLEFALQLQESKNDKMAPISDCDEGFNSNSGCEPNGKSSMVTKSIVSNSFISGAAFSELMDPKAR
ncbi:receptor-like protein kinase FERONIA [Corylus avellana]|uniref:receptor-like protein kinase FERONIA n=1 Tax=Corylus avellana TaxID=13451 RepID=UPI00286BBF5F|nr:receptor-like protein kinase FERONIA [Corylus avellana]